MTRRRFRWCLASWVLLTGGACLGAEPGPAARRCKATAFKIPSQYTNQESGYFSLIEGHNGRLYIGAAKYGVDAYLIEFDPASRQMRAVVDVQKLIGSTATGFAAQSKIHTRNTVGASGKIYCGSKQGYPQKGEKRSDYPGGYVITYDPLTGTAEHFGIAMAHQGIISVRPDERRGVAYLSTCDDGPPDRSSAHFMILDLRARTYRDLGDLHQIYAFIVLDDRGRAYHPALGGRIGRYDPATDRLAILPTTIDGRPVEPGSLLAINHPLNWDASPDGKTLYAIAMSGNMLYAYDLTAPGPVIPGRRLGVLLGSAKTTDCRAMCVGPTGTVWAAVFGTTGSAEGALHLVSYHPGDARPQDHGMVTIANPGFTAFTDAHGKPLPWHHGIRTTPDGAMVPLYHMAICQARDGSVYMTTIAPFTLLKFIVSH